MQEVVLAHPPKVRAIADARIKTDKIDSETLAHLVRSNLIPAAYAPSKLLSRIALTGGEAMLNRIELIGRLTRDPAVRYLSGGHPLGVLSYAGETPRIVFRSPAF